MARRLPVADDCCPAGDRSRPGGRTSRARAVPVFRALGDATRLEILALISSRPEPICVCDITMRFPLRQPTISHHLKVLRDAGLVTATRRGTWSYYAVDAKGARAARSALDAILPEVAAVR